MAWGKVGVNTIVDCWNKTEIINDAEEFSFGNFIEDSLLEDNAEIVDLMPKLGISESDLLSVDEWIGVDSAVSVAQGTMPSDEDIVATIAGDESDVEEDEYILNVINSASNALRYANRLKAYIQQQSEIEVSLSFLNELINLEKNLAVQEINSKKQTKIDRFFNLCNDA